MDGLHERERDDAENETAARAGVPTVDGGFLRAGRSPGELAKEFEPSANTSRQGVQRDEVAQGRGDGATTGEEEDLRRLRRENRQLKLEREILGKAAAWFARETDSVQSGQSSS